MFQTFSLTFDSRLIKELGIISFQDNEQCPTCSMSDVCYIMWHEKHYIMQISFWSYPLEIFIEKKVIKFTY